MKRLLVLLLAVTFLIPLSACGFGKTYTALVDSEGDVLEMHVELVWNEDAHDSADGLLVFMPGCFPEYLARFGDESPLVVLGDAPEIRLGTEGYQTSEGGETVAVFDEDGLILAEGIALAEAVSRGKSEWSGKPVYIYFTVTYRTRYLFGGYSATKRGYIVKTVFQ